MTNELAKVHFVVEKTIHCKTTDWIHGENIAHTNNVPEVTCGACIDRIQSELDCAKRRRQD